VAVDEACRGGNVRAALTYGAAFVVGAALFFLSFAAIFNGSWALLLLFLGCYAAAGALAVWIGGVSPMALALVLAGPALPWVLWLFPASILEAGVLRALLWPGLALLMGGLGWLGGKAVAIARVRPGSDSRVSP
jgi:hypothetical protein